MLLLIEPAGIAAAIVLYNSRNMHHSCVVSYNEMSVEFLHGKSIHCSQKDLFYNV